MRAGRLVGLDDLGIKAQEGPTWSNQFSPHQPNIPQQSISHARALWSVVAPCLLINFVRMSGVRAHQGSWQGVLAGDPWLVCSRMR